MNWMFNIFIGHFRKIPRQPQDQKLLETKEGWPWLWYLPLCRKGTWHFITTLSAFMFELQTEATLSVLVFTLVLFLTSKLRWSTTLQASWPRTGTPYLPTSSFCWGLLKTSWSENWLPIPSPKQVLLKIGDGPFFMRKVNKGYYYFSATLMISV